MTSEEAEPVGVMSRLPRQGQKVATGGRSCGYKGERKGTKRKKRGTNASSASVTTMDPSSENSTPTTSGTPRPATRSTTGL